MMRLPTVLALLSVVLIGESAGLAHHSFAVFFDPTKTVVVRGKVTEFAFRNPHGEIGLEVRNEHGDIEQWRAETNAPVILVRRGWTRQSLKHGEVVTIEGWPSRDGRRYIRMRKATRADGTVIGKPFEENAQQ
jgi:hypothetical protein